MKTETKSSVETQFCALPIGARFRWLAPPRWNGMTLDREQVKCSEDGFADAEDFDAGQTEPTLLVNEREAERLVITKREATPNDPKLSDGGAWRGACPTVARTNDAQM